MLVAVAATTAAAGAEAAEAVAAVVTAAGHLRPGPGQHRCACVSSVKPLEIAAAVVPGYLGFILEGGHSASPKPKQAQHRRYVLRVTCHHYDAYSGAVPPSVQWGWQCHLQLVSVIQSKQQCGQTYKGSLDKTQFSIGRSPL